MSGMTMYEARDGIMNFLRPFSGIWKIRESLEVAIQTIEKQSSITADLEARAKAAGEKEEKALATERESTERALSLLSAAEKDSAALLEKGRETLKKETADQKTKLAALTLRQGEDLKKLKKETDELDLRNAALTRERDALQDEIGKLNAAKRDFMERLKA